MLGKRRQAKTFSRPWVSQIPRRRCSQFPGRKKNLGEHPSGGQVSWELQDVGCRELVTYNSPLWFFGEHSAPLSDHILTSIASPQEPETRKAKCRSKIPPSSLIMAQAVLIHKNPKHTQANHQVQAGRWLGTGISSSLMDSHVGTSVWCGMGRFFQLLRMSAF